MFSSTVKLADLDDFLQPAQDCVVPILQTADDSDKAAVLQARAEDLTGRVKPDLIKVPKKKTADSNDVTAAQVSLYDCLSCSGCVTSAEVVLLQEFSADVAVKLLKAQHRRRDAIVESKHTSFSSLEDLPQNGNTPLVTLLSVSTPSLLLLSKMYDRAPASVLACLHAVLAPWGVFVVDFTCAEALAVLGVELEYHRRREMGDRLPLITSHCPGWICYLEKVVDPSYIKFASEAPSAQAIQGRLVKSITFEMLRIGKRRQARSDPPVSSRVLHGARRLASAISSMRLSELRHMTVMSCFDKKLESMRDEFKSVDPMNHQRLPDVDLCLGTQELVQLLDKLKCTLDGCAGDTGTGTILSISASSITPLTFIPVRAKAESGGFLEFIRSQLTKTVDDIPKNLPLAEDTLYKVLKNEDFGETKIGSGINGKKPEKGLFAYGFRNIQNVLRRLEGGKSGGHDDVIEMMACPHGCLNGGAHIDLMCDSYGNDDPARHAKHDLMKKMTSCHPASNPCIDSILSYIDGGAQAVLLRIGKEISLEESQLPVTRMQSTSHNQLFDDFLPRFKLSSLREGERGRVRMSDLRW